VEVQSTREIEAATMPDEVSIVEALVGAACWALRSLLDALDGIDALTDQLANVSGSIAKLDELDH
jgi:hypothetical protein